MITDLIFTSEVNEREHDERKDASSSAVENRADAKTALRKSVLLKIRDKKKTSCTFQKEVSNKTSFF